MLAVEGARGQLTGRTGSGPQSGQDGGESPGSTDFAVLSRDKASALGRRLGYRFRRPERLHIALTHRSALEGAASSNERLEFLGDAVIGVAIAHALFRRFPRATEGELTKLKGRLASRQHLSRVARRLRVGDCLRLGKGEEICGGRDNGRLLADGLEAVFGAVYLDGGIQPAFELAERWILREDELAHCDSDEEIGDRKGRLQEWLQRRGHRVPDYVLLSEDGPDHRPVFTVEARCLGGSVTARGVGATKRQAQKRAAAKALSLLTAMDHDVTSAEVATSIA